MRHRTSPNGFAAVAAATGVLLAGCGGGDDSASTQGGGDGNGQQAQGRLFETTAMTPAAAGPIDAYSWSVTNDPSSLDPAQTARQSYTEVIRSAICESLLRVDADRKTEPALASEVDNPDPLTWVYTLRDGARFHDGSTLAADDVVASLSRHMEPELGSVVASAFANVGSIDATGPMEVTVKLERPDYLFNSLMGGEAGRVESAEFLEQAGSDYGAPGTGVNCTGPYALAKWNTGQSMELTKFDDYWDEDLQPSADSVRIVFAGEPSARINALIAGDVDGSYVTPNNANAKLEQADSGELYIAPATGVHSMVANTEGILGDVRVRKALSMALDRQGIVKSGYDNYAAPAKSVIDEAAWQGVGGEQHFAELPELESDPQAAKALIDEAGVAGKEIVISYTNVVPEMGVMANGFYAAAQQLGLEPKLNELAPPDFSALNADPSGTDLYPVYLRQSSGDPLESYQIFHSDSGFNYGAYSNPQYDELVQQALSEEDPEQRTAITAKLAQLASEELPWIPIAVPAYATFVGNRITGGPTSAETLLPWAAQFGAGS